MTGCLAPSGTGMASSRSVRPPCLSSASGWARRFRAQWVLPRGATRYRLPSSSSTLTGTRRHSPELRPRVPRTGTDPSAISTGLTIRLTKNDGFRYFPNQQLLSWSHAALRSRAAARLLQHILVRVGIVGLGLMGGSLALALRKARPGWELIGLDADPATQQKALDMGVVSAGEVRTADLVVLAAPIPALPELLSGLAGYAGVVTDLASTK